MSLKLKFHIGNNQLLVYVIRLHCIFPEFLNNFSLYSYFMMRLYLALLLFFTVSTQAQQKDGYSIKVTFKPFKNQFIYLAYYYGTQYPVVDSVKLDDKSEGVFKGNKKLGGGIYLIGYPDKSRFFEFLLDKEQQFSITADSADVVHTLKFDHSPENILFNNYQQYMLTKGQEIEKSKNKLASTNDHKDSVKLNDLINCPASMVETAALLKSDTPLPSSVKLPPEAVAVRVGASLTGTTVTTDAIAKPLASTPPLVTPPVSTICDKVTVRAPLVGS